jgi:tetratricopeptide (TPR) repeat protein
MVLLGPDGSGKSTLAARARSLAEAAGRPCFYVGADPSGSARPWWPIRSVCRELLGLSRKPSLVDLEGVLELHGIDRANLMGLGELLGVGGERSGLEHAARRREGTASALAALRKVAGNRKAVLIFDDLERFDAPSRDLVDRLLAHPDAPLTVLATRTGGPFCPVPSAAPLEVVEIEPLSEADVRLLAEQALGEASPGMVASLMQITGGLPLHVDQSLRYLFEGGGEPNLGLADSIGTRIAHLPQDARTLLQTVALGGGEADDALLHAIAVDATAEALAMLLGRGFAARSGGVARILHPLIVDVAYAGMPEEARRTLHGRVWQALEAAHAEPKILGRHAYEAGDRRAVPILERAGERAQREFDDAGAAIEYRRAVALQRWAMLEGAADAETTFVRLSVKLGEALYWSGDTVGAEGVLREALGYAQGHAGSEARVRLSLARLFIAWGQLERAEKELRAGLRVAFKAGDATLLGELYLEFGTLRVRRGELEGAIDELAEGINLCTGGEGAEAEVGPDVLWRLVARHAETLQAAGDTPAALAVGKHALRHARRVRSTVGEARVHALLAQLYGTARETRTASEHRVQALELTRRLGDRRSTAELLIADASTALAEGAVRPGSLRDLHEAAQLAAQVDWQEGVAQSEQVLRQSQPPAGSPSR